MAAPPSYSDYILDIQLFNAAINVIQQIWQPSLGVGHSTVAVLWYVELYGWRYKLLWIQDDDQERLTSLMPSPVLWQRRKYYG